MITKINIAILPSASPRRFWQLSTRHKSNGRGKFEEATDIELQGIDHLLVVTRHSTGQYDSNSHSRFTGRTHFIIKNTII